MRKRFLVGVLCGVLMLSLSGCEREKVEYGQQETVQSESDAGEVTEEGYVYTDGIAKTIGAEEKIQEQIETNDGKKLNIYGDVIVPDVKTLNVYSATRQEIDTEFKKQMVDAFSDDGVIYCGEEDKLPKSALKQNVLLCECQQKNLEADYAEGHIDDDLYREYQAECDEKQTYYNNLYEQAGETYQKTDYDAWEDGEKVVIYHDGVPYYMGAYDYSMDCFAVDYIDVLTDLPDDAEAVAGYVYGYNGYGRRVDDEEEQEKLKKAAADFADMIDVGSFTVADFEDICYAGFTVYRTEGEMEGKDCGYYVRLCRTLDGVKVDANSYLGVPTYVDMQEMMDGNLMTEYKPMESMTIVLDEAFQVIGFQYEWPLHMPEVESTKVSLLSYKTIKENLLDSLAKQPVEDGTGSISDEEGNVSYEIEQNYTDLELLYFRMENPDKVGEYLLVPAWRLEVSGADYYRDNACVINAIDGSRIDILKEVFELVEVDTEE